ncbi:unnamed protein product [Bursaphelenchus okinawaensis]|uniref:Transmembrane protein 17 n=1 Tax=Bursaphelenchus okinawaensis TaxID=465554 RepID=A0A811L9K8_9BILA|nr:unnamed protein product [Bursaphelenchus okinawaensis]CAG9121596.1 unnamed protein product [Bursaphelenchus okinawaensis]
MEKAYQRIDSSLPFQMLNHFHLHLSPFIIFSQVACFYMKYDRLHPILQIVCAALYIVLITLECVRPYLGYYGNLSEKIPPLSGYCAVTALFNIPINVFFLFNPDVIQLPLEKIVFSFTLTFYVLELIISARLIYRLSQKQIRIIKEQIDNEPQIRKKSK